MKNLVYHALSNNSHWRINKQLMKKVHPYSAVMLSILVDKWNDFGRKDWFEYKIEYFLRNFGDQLSHESLAKYLKQLIDIGLIEKELRGVPATTNYKINFDLIGEFLDEPEHNYGNSQFTQTASSSLRKQRDTDYANSVNPPYINKNTKENKEGEPSNFSNSLNEEATPLKEDLKTWHKKEKETPHAESNQIKMVTTQEIKAMAGPLRGILKKELKGDFDILCSKIDASVLLIMESFSEYWLAACGREFIKTNSKGLGASFRAWIGIPTAKDVKRAEAVSSPSNNEYFYDIFEELSKMNKFTLGKEDRMQINKALTDLDLSQENWVDVCNRFRGGIGCNCEDFLTIARSLDRELKLFARLDNKQKNN